MRDYLQQQEAPLCYGSGSHGTSEDKNAEECIRSLQEMMLVLLLELCRAHVVERRMKMVHVCGYTRAIVTPIRCEPGCRDLLYVAVVATCLTRLDCPAGTYVNAITTAISGQSTLGGSSRVLFTGCVNSQSFAVFA